MRPHLTYANVTSTLAVCLALGGTGAYAATLITGADVKDESLTGADIVGRPASAAGAAVNGSLTTYDIKDASLLRDDLASGSVTGAKVATNTLTGADILESSLGKVNDADTLDGKDSTALETTAGAGLEKTGTALALAAGGVGMRELEPVFGQGGAEGVPVFRFEKPLGPAVTPSVGGWCLVTINVQFHIRTANATRGPGVWVGVEDGGDLWTDGGYADHPPTGVTGDVTMSRTRLMQVIAGNTVRFGVALNDLTSDWRDDTYDMYETHVCF